MDTLYSTKFLDLVRSSHPHSAQPVLAGLYDAIIRGDFDAMAEFLTDDVELKILGAGALDGTWRGREAVIAAARANFGQVSQQQPEIESIVSQGDSTAVLFRESGLFKIEGSSYRFRVVQWFTFTAGKVSKIDEIVALDPA